MSPGEGAAEPWEVAEPGSEEVSLSDLPAPPRVEVEPHLSGLPPPPTSKGSSHDDLPPPAAATHRPDPPPAREPYGDPRGWSNRRTGSPWATQVMAALNAIEFPETAGESVDVDFRLSVCKDGSLLPELVGGTGPKRAETELVERLAKTTVPPPPPAVAAKMKSDCAKLDYTFKWTGNAIR